MPPQVQPVGITLTIPQLLALTAGDVVPTPDSPKSKSTEFLDLGDLVTDWGLEPEEIQSIWVDLQRHKQKMSHSLSHHLRTSLDPPSLGRARVSHWLDNVTVPGNPSLYLDPNSPSALVPFQDTFKLKKHLIAGEDPPVKKLRIDPAGETLGALDPAGEKTGALDPAGEITILRGTHAEIFQNLHNSLGNEREFFLNAPKSPWWTGKAC